MQDAYKIVPKKLKNSGIDYSYSGTTAASFI